LEFLRAHLYKYAALTALKKRTRRQELFGAGHKLTSRIVFQRETRWVAKCAIHNLGQMMRIFFWTFVAVGLAAFFFAASRQKDMTADENTLLWGSVACGVMAIIGFGSVFLLFYFWKKRIAIMVGYYGGRKVWSRDSQPFVYWCIMLFYFLAGLFFLSVAFLVGLKLLPTFQKLLNH
jgi:hypothetical protein